MSSNPGSQPRPVHGSAPAPRDPLVEAFDRLCIDSPEQPLVLSPAGVVTVGEIDRLAGNLAERWLEQTRPPGVVGLAAANGSRFLAALIALLRRGCTPLLLDAKTPVESLPGVVTRFGGRWVVVAGESMQKWRTMRCPDSPVEPWLGGVIKLSSGSSGEPTGIATPIPALIADDTALRRSMGIEAGDRLLAMVPFSHSYGLSSLVVPAITHGIPLVVPSGSSPFSALQAAEDFGATVAPTVPSFLKALVRMNGNARLPSSLRLVISAGAPLPPDVAAAFESTFGLPVHVFYGSSETGGITYDRTGTSARRGTLGTPVDGVEVRLDRAEGSGEHRRVAVRSDAVAERYLPEPDADLDGGEFRTSDLAEWVDGELCLLGRLGRLLNVRGKKVHPREVEEVIGQLTEVDETLVRQAPEAEALVAIVVANEDAAITSTQIVDWCRDRLAPHKIPRRILIVDEIPRTTRGKVDRIAIDQLLAGVHDGSREAG